MTRGAMCFGRKASDVAVRRHDEIEKQLRIDQKKAGREVKLLLLGAGESGKSTVLKQMRIIHTGGFSMAEREHWRMIIFDNLVDAFRVLLEAMREYGTRFEDEDNIRSADLLSHESEINPGDPMPAKFLDVFLSLWADRGVQQAILKGNEYALHDNLSYFFDDFERLFDRTYLPSDQDILRTRLRTTGICETTFDVGPQVYRMMDVGGQRSERRKWIHAFDNVNAVLFLAAISGYDQALVEARDGNQMHEALYLFKNIANSRYFSKAALILFLNKMDIFREKVSAGMAPIQREFPDYKGDDDDVEAGQEFFASKFRKLVSRPLYIHYTNATDTDLLKRTMCSVQSMIMQGNLDALVL